MSLRQLVQRTVEMRSEYKDFLIIAGATMTGVDPAIDYLRFIDKQHRIPELYLTFSQGKGKTKLTAKDIKREFQPEDGGYDIRGYEIRGYEGLAREGNKLLGKLRRKENRI